MLSSFSIPRTPADETARKCRSHVNHTPICIFLGFRQSLNRSRNAKHRMPCSKCGEERPQTEFLHVKSAEIDLRCDSVTAVTWPADGAVPRFPGFSPSPIPTNSLKPTCHSFDHPHSFSSLPAHKQQSRFVKIVVDNVAAFD
jgi:hypothetical protein